MLLDEILAAKRAELAMARRERPASELRARLRGAPRSLQEALRRGRTGLILEVKRRSPSAGTLRAAADAAAIARIASRRADALSVLTDAGAFGGSLEDLRRASEAATIPVLRKDFILDPYQVLEAREAGADAVLLILAVLDDDGWGSCAAEARALGMDVLTEVHTEQEMDRALRLGAPIIGVNSRDLRTFRIDAGLVERLAPRAGPGRIVVAESGVGSRADVRALRRHADALLVGSAIMRLPDVDAAARGLVYGEVKICGLTRPEDARAAWEAGATWGGLVLAAGSPRRIDLDRAREVRRAAPLRWAGVFVDPGVEEVGEAARALGLDAVQLHGEEPPSLVAAVRRALPALCEVWKGVRVDGRVPRLAETAADRFLLDAFHPERRGGTGRRFDWDLLRHHPDRHRAILAGGIGPEEAAAAEAVGASMIDVSSRVESAPGIKSPRLLGELFGALRRSGAEP